MFKSVLNYGLLLLVCLLTACQPKQAAHEPSATSDTAKLQVVASFSILADITQEIGGERVQVHPLVAPDQDAHVYTPTPSDVKKLAQAKVLVSNGLGFEGWLDRLAQSADFKGTNVVATQDISALKRRAHGEVGHDHEHDHEHQGDNDPHAWHDMNLVQTVYIKNIVAGLSQADPAGADYYQKRGQAYAQKIAAAHEQIKTQIARVPESQRQVVTSHDAFGYLARAYGVRFLAPQGVSTESEPSAKAIAQLMTQIKTEHIKTLFVENISNPKLITQIEQETGAKLGGKLYSDALSGSGGVADSYLKLMNYNMTTLIESMR